MLHVLLSTLLIIAIGVVLLSVRLFFNRDFVHTHVDGNKALNDKGIHCAQALDKELRRPRRFAVSEKSSSLLHRETTHL